MVERKHWKIYRGRMEHKDNGSVLFWSSSESGVKRIMAQAAREDKNYERPGQYASVYIEPTKRGLVEWLERNVTRDNG